MFSSAILLGIISVAQGRGFNWETGFSKDLSSGREDVILREKRSPSGGQMKFPETAREPRDGAHAFTRSSNECGIQRIPFTPPEHNRMPRIRNGTCTPYGAMPWTAQIQIKKNGEYVHHCGGAIISDKYIITARHCFGSRSDKNIMRVVVGQHNIHVMESKEMAFQIDNIWLHTKYQSAGPHSYDIALIKIRTKGDGQGIRFSQEVQSLCLPGRREHFKDDLQCVISGWGRIKPFGNIHPECLRAATVPLINQRKCEKMYKYSSQKLLDNMVCAGYTSGGVDACKGDSGGPLACYKDGTYKLVGIVSWGHGCGKANNPGVFTRVQKFLDWIEGNQRF